MSKTQRLRLPDENAVHVVRYNVVDGFGQIVLALLAQFALELEIGIKVILDRPLGPTRHEDELGYASCNAPLHGILNDRLVNDKKQILWYCVRSGQEARPKPRHGKNGLANMCRAISSIVQDAR